LLNRSDKIIAIKPLADPGNSFVRLFSDAIAQQGYPIRDFDWNGIETAGAHAAILHWPYEVLGLGGLRGIGRYVEFRRKLIRARARGTRIIWVAHNAQPHDGGWVSGLLMRRFIGMIDGIIHLSHHSRELVDQLYAPPARIVQAETVHGHYLDVLETPVQPATPVGAQVRLGYFGQIRRYKNVELLARLVSAMPAEVMLGISGRRSHEDVAAQIERIAADAPNILLDIRREPLPDADMERAVDAADGIVLPYQAILNSGAAIFALSRGRPVLAPRTGSLPELQQLVGADWLQLYDGEIDARALRDFAIWLRGRSSSRMPDLTALSWDRVSDDIGGLLDAVITR
jgi:beta-1,4-mannosyltransferase